MKKTAQLFCLILSLSILIIAGDSIVEKISPEPKKITSCKENPIVTSLKKEATNDTSCAKTVFKEDKKKIEPAAQNETKKVASTKKTNQNRYALKKESKKEIAPVITEKTVVTQVVVQEKKIEQVDAKKEARTVEIKNCITKEMITYHHWTGKHTPEFILKINDKEIKEASAVSIPVTSDKVNIEYSFNFANGYYKDTKKVEVALPEGSQFALEFSWKTTPNIKVAAISK